MPKRRHDLDDSDTSEHGGKRLKTDANGNTNGYIENGSSTVEYWLVRKPKNVNPSDLPVLHIPKKIPEEGREKEKGDFNIRFSHVNKQMFVIDRSNRSSSNNLVQHKAIGTIKGIMSIDVQKPAEDIGPIAPEEDYMNPVDLEMPKFNFTIGSIRKPVPSVDDVTERLTAFGVPKPVARKSKKKKKH
uniref:BLVR domain-containing protein n=1 Tax=Panagrellus redivivus TaxID=6233 RepID=A0A7E4UMC4_PANRE